MANTFSCLNSHCVFSTKERVPVLTPEIRENLWPYLGGIAKQNGLRAKCVGGVADHVHLLLSLPTTIAVSKAIQLMKAGSSAWIHQAIPKTAKLFLATGLWGIQRRNLSNARDHSVYRATGRTSSNADISRGVSGHLEKARYAVRR